MNAASTNKAPKNKCPVCGKAPEAKVKPFCSQRCATIDLGRWLGEGYKIPATEDPDEGEDGPLTFENNEA
ncbi:MAG: DNA gyrase inhibitor YacG [Alphaproteobacteria bacterium]|nr:DNA gyrase inhibitor YacG [Alphaproteobacteria bacterium]